MSKRPLIPSNLLAKQPRFKTAYSPDALYFKAADGSRLEVRYLKESFWNVSVTTNQGQASKTLLWQSVCKVAPWAA